MLGFVVVMGHLRMKHAVGRLAFWSREGGCDELREVVSGCFRRSTLSCNRSRRLANCITNAINKIVPARAQAKARTNRRWRTVTLSSNAPGHRRPSVGCLLVCWL